MAFTNTLSIQLPFWQLRRASSIFFVTPASLMLTLALYRFSTVALIFESPDRNVLTSAFLHGKMHDFKKKSMSYVKNPPTNLIYYFKCKHSILYQNVVNSSDCNLNGQEAFHGHQTNLWMSVTVWPCLRSFPLCFLFCFSVCRSFHAYLNTVVMLLCVCDLR